MASTPHYVKVVEKLATTERLAEDVLNDRQEMVALDMRRNMNREALGHLKRKKLAACEPTLYRSCCIF
eukprot:m.50506 g.50506  ORF g.50506 m.50506 type:complete len:68 (-) comp10674_c0_seq1:409-612(-)